MAALLCHPWGLPKCLGFNIFNSCCHPSSALSLSSVPGECMVAGMHSVLSSGSGKTGLAAKITCCHGNAAFGHCCRKRWLRVLWSLRRKNESTSPFSSIKAACLQPPWSWKMLGGVTWRVRESPPGGFMGLWPLCDPVLSAGTQLLLLQGHLPRPKYIPVVSREAKVIKPIPREIVQSKATKINVNFVHFSHSATIYPSIKSCRTFVVVVAN